jgi:hypothetical protein
VLVTVTKESTLFRSELKFVAVEGTQIRPTCATKNSKR